MYFHVFVVDLIYVHTLILIQNDFKMKQFKGIYESGLKQNLDIRYNSLKPPRDL